jgi:hypothetical protein
VGRAIADGQEEVESAAVRQSRVEEQEVARGAPQAGERLLAVPRDANPMSLAAQNRAEQPRDFVRWVGHQDCALRRHAGIIPGRRLGYNSQPAILAGTIGPIRPLWPVARPQSCEWLAAARRGRGWERRRRAGSHAPGAMGPRRGGGWRVACSGAGRADLFRSPRGGRGRVAAFRSPIGKGSATWELQAADRRAPVGQEKRRHS